MGFLARNLTNFICILQFHYDFQFGIESPILVDDIIKFASEGVYTRVNWRGPYLPGMTLVSSSHQPVTSLFDLGVTQVIYVFANTTGDFSCVTFLVEIIPGNFYLNEWIFDTLKRNLTLAFGSSVKFLFNSCSMYDVLYCKHYHQNLSHFSIKVNLKQTCVMGALASHVWPMFCFSLIFNIQFAAVKIVAFIPRIYFEHIAAMLHNPKSKQKVEK